MGGSLGEVHRGGVSVWGGPYGRVRMGGVKVGGSQCDGGSGYYTGEGGFLLYKGGVLTYAPPHLPPSRQCAPMSARRRHGPKGADAGPPRHQTPPPPHPIEEVDPPPPALYIGSDPPHIGAEPPPAMSCRDRTAEFLSACKSLQGRQVGGGGIFGGGSLWGG